MKRKQEVINALKGLLLFNDTNSVHFRELFNYINDTRRHYRKGMAYQELRGKCMSMSEIELKDDIVRLR